MRIILFIGHHKVGTSSLQNFFAENFHPFLNAGVLYPMVEFEGLTQQMARGLAPKSDASRLGINAREAHNALAFKMIAEQSEKRRVPPYHKGLPRARQMFNAILQQITSFNPHTVILCAEVFANFATIDQALIKNLANVFEPKEVSIVATLRRPDAYITSWQGQRLKFGHKMQPLFDDGLNHYFGSIHLDYRKMLEGWTRTFDPQTSQWILRDYRDVLKAGGSINDFLAQTGLKQPKGARDVPNRNPSIPDALMELARLGNNMLPRTSARSLREYLMQASSRLTLPNKAEIEHFGADNRAALIKRFAPIHDWLQDLTGQRPFFADMDDVARLRPLPVTNATASVLDAVQKDAQRYADDPHLVADLSKIAQAFA